MYKELKVFVKFTMLFLSLASVFFANSSSCVLAAQVQRTGQVVTYSRVRGWEASLVQGSPNLARFYWEPMTRRTINRTSTTGHQAIHLPLPVVNHFNSARISPVASSPVPHYSTAGKAKLLTMDAASGSDGVLTYKGDSHLVISNNHHDVDVHGQLVSSKTFAKCLPKRALIAHQLSLGDDYGK